MSNKTPFSPIPQTPEPKRYEAQVELSYPTNPGIIARIQDGEKIPFEQRETKQIQAGDIVSDIPSVSIPWLLEQGLIKEVV